ncbi:MAG: alkaline phosphatase D family protein, partial [Rubrobacter sp.]
MGTLASLGEIDRRTFVKLTGASAAAVVFGLGPYTEKAAAQSRLPDGLFKLGVASGDPSSAGVVLWTRLAPEPLTPDGGMPNGRVEVRWEVARNENFSRVVNRGTATARPERAHSVHVGVSGLAPATEYYYRFRAGNETSPVGRTKTAPRKDARLDRLAFAFASCQMYEHGYYHAYRDMSRQDLDLVVHLGDYNYE